MPKLIRAELDQHRAWLSEWRSPDEFRHRVAAVNDAMGSAAFFRQGGTEFLRDAFLGGEFGRLRQCEAVRLVATQDRWPDFEARDADGSVESVECAEADIPGRRRGDEYRQIESRLESGEFAFEEDPVEDWYARAEAAPAALAATVAKKLEKRYPPGASLLIYLNIHEWDVQRAEIEAAMALKVAPALPVFQRTWILWNGRLYGPWAGDVPDVARGRSYRHRPS